MKAIIISLTLLILIVQASFAQVEVMEQEVTVVEENALTIYGKFSNAINGRTFQKDVLITHKGYQYIAYYNAERRVCISRRKLPSGAWERIAFTDYLFESNDAHNVVSMGICPNDGTIHLAFDHHVHPLKYRRSIIGLANHPETMAWDASSFGPVLSELEKGTPIKVTYPKFWQTPDGNLQFNYRQGGSGSGDRMLVDYDATSGLWKNGRQIDSREGSFEDVIGTSPSRCSYPNGYDYDSEGKLHTTFVWRETPSSTNHDLMYVYSEDQGQTWKNNEGETLKDIPNLNSPGITVQDIPRVLGLQNDHGQTIDSKDRIHVTMPHCTEETIKAAGYELGEKKWGPSEAKRYHHYWRNDSAQWMHFELPVVVGNRPKVFADKDDNLILIYAGTSSTDFKNENTDNDLIVAVASFRENWKDWHIAHVVKGPFVNDMLGDFYRWKSEGVLSIMLQDYPHEKAAPSQLRVVDLKIDFNNTEEQAKALAIPQDIMIHTFDNSNVPRSDFHNYTHWYQEKGNTQTFMLHPGDCNTRNKRKYCRIEAHSTMNMLKGEDHEFTATYHIHKLEEIACIFQVFNISVVHPQLYIKMLPNGELHYQSRGNTPGLIDSNCLNKDFTLHVKDNGDKWQLFYNGHQVSEGLHEEKGKDTICKFRWGLYNNNIPSTEMLSEVRNVIIK